MGKQSQLTSAYGYENGLGDSTLGGQVSVDSSTLGDQVSVGYSLVPRLLRGRRKESLVHTVRACAKFHW